MAQSPFTTVGTKTSEIPVAISYRIIELFSGGLYSSPNKAVEELVTNAYDALAQRVDVLVAPNPSNPDATIWVVDDGESMDAAGLEDLWKIAHSRKREGDESPDRPPIGRFGIGKLATFVLAQQLTYVCKKDGCYLAVTMDYGQIPHQEDASTSPVSLDLRELTEDQARAALEPMRTIDGGRALLKRLFGDDAPETWTVAAMSELRPLAASLRIGRLNWILSTALPMSPAFALTLNGNAVTSALERRTPLAEWRVGADDDPAAERLELQTGTGEKGPFVVVGDLGIVRGHAAVYEDELTRNKAGETGRSHGFFVKVRGRLLNLDDALFGIRSLSHQTFARFRMELDVDGLDPFLRSTREAVLDTPDVELLRDYMIAKFNEARVFYTAHVARLEEETRLSTRIGRTPASLSRRPLWSAVARSLDGEIDPVLIRVPAGLTPDARDDLLRELEASLEEPDGLIRSVEWRPLGADQYLAVYDAGTQTVQVNVLHPFLANFAAHNHSPIPFALMAVAEILTEAYLLEQLAPAEVRALIDRRDRFLRELVYSGELPGAPVVAQMLLDARTNEEELERALALAFKSLGFEVTKIGGSGKPDGLAHARLGVRSLTATAPDDYQLTFDAKSSGHERVANGNVRISALARHRDDYNADFAVVVAPDFEAGEDPDGALNKEARANNVSPIRVEDFALLVRIAATRQLGYAKLRELFETARSPDEARDWIRALLDEEGEDIPVADILRTIWDLMGESDDPVTFGALNNELRHRGIRVREQQLREWMESLVRLVREYISIDDNTVMLENNVDKVLDAIRQHGSMMPADVLRQSYLQPLLNQPAETDSAPQGSTTSSS
ncbi:MAG: ATP-binding protein [Thermoleophilaceae bacterium]